MNDIDTQSTIQKIFSPYKGILAADESTPTITKRFKELGLTSTPELNKKYREMLFSTPDFEKYISGVILFDESLKQGLGEILNNKGVLVGIKVDEGLEDFSNSEEQVTKGLDNLDVKLDEYIKLGAKFTKWRGVFKISDLYPSDTFIEENLKRMATYAKRVQDKGLTPIVEPEILLDGNHTTTRCEEITTKVLKRLFVLLNEQGVNNTNLVLKTSMVLAGKDSGVISLPLEVSNATLRTFKNSLPTNLYGIVFLSGGQSPDSAINNLNEIVKLNKSNNFGPWDISFSYSRALQNDCLATWLGKDENISDAQEVFLKRLKMVSTAREGEL